MSKDNEELEFLDQQADAWLKVARLLDELSPNWVTKDKSGVEAALEAIREFAAKKQAEPVAWRYKVNNTHTCFSEIEPPDDAYDEGTLVALYLAPAGAQEPVLQRVMGRLADLLDEDQFAEIEGIVVSAGIAPPPPAAAINEQLLEALKHAQKVLNHNNLALDCVPVNDAIRAAEAEKAKGGV